jgi:hypothetical protein
MRVRAATIAVRTRKAAYTSGGHVMLKVIHRVTNRSKRAGLAAAEPAGISRPGRPRHRAASPVLGRPVPVTIRWSGLVTALCVTAAVVAPHISVDPALRRVLLFAHLTALVLGFGAVLATDAQILAWLAGRREFADVIRFAAQVHGVIWFGLGGLIASGLLLSPQVDVRYIVKMCLVPIIAVCGVVAGRLRTRIFDIPVARDLMTNAAVLGLLSHTAWWGTTLLGFAASTSGP